MHNKLTVGLVAIVAILPLAACDTLGSANEPDVSVSFAVPGANGSLRSASLIPITDGANTLDLQNVDVTFDEVVLERSEDSVNGDSDGESDVDSDSEGVSNETLRRGPFVVALPVAGGLITPINEALPAGVYEEIELDVNSVRLRGTYNGQAFDVTVPINTELDLEFDEPFVIDDAADRINLTVAINFANWFRTSSGALIDPNLLLTNASARAQFVSRIRASFRAFEDSDKDADEHDTDSDSK